MNMLIVSDLHIAGCVKLPNKELNKSQNKIIELLEHYSLNRIDDTPWTLVINGDAIDFMSVTVYPAEDGSLEDKLHGLSSTVEKTKIKIKSIIEHYSEIFTAIAKFVVAGNKLKIISGNHDLELSFKEIQTLFIEEIHKLVDCDLTLFSQNIEFYPWFYYEPGKVYIEHGHQYDEYCSTDYHLALMDNKTDIVPSVSHLGMRYFANKFPHYDPYNAEEWGFSQYVKWAYNLGGKKALTSLFHYGILVFKTLALWYKLRITEKERKEVNDKDLIAHANATNIKSKKLRKLYLLRSFPVTRNLFKIISTYFIDRMILIMVGLICTIFFTVYLHHHWKFTIPIVTLTIIYLLNKVFNKIRFNAPSSVKLHNAAEKISEIINAKIISFGHSHAPEVTTFENGTTYINSGSWVEDGKCTYVLITKDGHELKYWQNA